MWATDIGNAYLESNTLKKVYIIAGVEFCDREVQILIVAQSLYGLQSSELSWNKRFSDFPRDMGFFMFKL